jgi:hypothetical protein
MVATRLCAALLVCVAHACVGPSTVEPTPTPLDATERNPAVATERNPPVEIVFTPEPQPIPAADVWHDPRCGALDLQAWSLELERASPDAREALLARIGLVIDDDFEDRRGPTPHTSLYLRNVRIHDVELGGPPGRERVVEVELADNPKLDDTHAHTLAQVFTQTPTGELCYLLEEGELSASFVGEDRPEVANADPKLSWGPLAIAFIELTAPGISAIEVHWAGGSTAEDIQVSEYTLSYWSFDERGKLVPIFEPFWLFFRRVNSEGEIQIIEVRGEVRVLGGQWPAQLETREDHAVQRVDEPKAERSTKRGTWQLRNGVYQSR